jgi:hypothetical protein
MNLVKIAALTLVAAAACVLTLRCYAALDTASLSDAFVSEDAPGAAGAIRASGIADGIRDAAVLLGFAGVLLALDRNRRPIGDDQPEFPDARGGGSRASW